MRRDKNFRLEDIIQQLLYRYDLVIIPGFGAIISRKKPARYNDQTHLFSPPYKDISFNPALKESDGLLVNYISKNREISHEEAMEWIKEEVEKWKRELHTHKRLILENIGIFTEVNDRLIFQALLNKNFLPEAYGLTSFIKTKSPQINQFMDQEQKNPDQKFEELVNSSERNNRGAYLKYAAVFVVGLALLGGGLYFYNHSQDAGPFQKATFVVEKEMPAVKVTDTSSLATETTEEMPQESTGDINAETNEAANEMATNNNEDKPDLSLYKYQIIVGGFKFKENADKKVQSLIDQGYHAQITGKNNKGLYMVAVEGGNTLEEAQNKMQDIYDLEPKAWIHKIQ